MGYRFILVPSLTSILKRHNRHVKFVLNPDWKLATSRERLLALPFNRMQDTTSRVSILDIEWKAQIVPTNGSFDAVCVPAFADRLGNAFSDEFISTIVMAKPFNVGTGKFGNPPAGGYDTISRILADYIQGTYRGPGRAFSPHDSHNLHSDCINIFKHIMLSAKMNN